MSATRPATDDLAHRFFEVTLDLACISDGERLLRTNSRWHELLGWTDDDLLGRPYERFIHPDDRSATSDRLGALRAGDGSGTFENRWRTSDGEWRTLAWTARVDSSSGLVLASARDVTAERRLEVERDQMTEVLTALGQLQSTYISEGLDRTWWNKALDTVISLSGSEFGFVGRVEHDEEGAPFLRSYAVTDIAWNDWSRQHYEAYAENGMEFHNLKTLFGVTLSTGELMISDDPATDDRRGGLPEGHPPLRSFVGIPLTDPEGLVGMIGLANRPGGFDRTMIDLFEPITAMLAQIISRDVSSKRADHDHLTGLANRAALMRELEPLLTADDRRRRQYGLLLVDLDGFKEINDTLGHQAGDRILVETARTAESAVRAGDLIARLGGDEFAVLLPDCDHDEIEQAARRLCDSIERVEVEPGRNLRASVGGIVVEGRPRSWEDVYAVADSNLYEAKRAGGNRSAISVIS